MMRCVVEAEQGSDRAIGDEAGFDGLSRLALGRTILDIAVSVATYDQAPTRSTLDREPTDAIHEDAGAGNDYVYVDCFAHPVPANIPDFARRISDRRFGVGGSSDRICGAIAKRANALSGQSCCKHIAGRLCVPRRFVSIRERELRSPL